MRKNRTPSAGAAAQAWPGFAFGKFTVANDPPRTRLGRSSTTGNTAASVVLVGLLLSSFDATRRYARLADLVAVLTGGAALVMIFMGLGEASCALIGRYNPDGVWAAVLGMGSYALIAGVAVLILSLVMRRGMGTKIAEGS